jgi:aspartate aminotransferase-like enzyme
MLNAKRLLTPGPVPIPKVVREVLSRPIVHHRTPEFELTLSFCLSALKKMFATNGHVFIHASTGSGGMESAIVNTLSPGDEVLCVVSGKFGERWAYMAEMFGLKVHRMEIPWGQATGLRDFESMLEQRPNVKAVLTQACETSTATLHPIREMALLVKERTNALFMVDAITAMGCMPMPMQEWNLDVVVAGSQKAFMLPTGLSFVGASNRALEAAQKNLQAKFYFRWDHELAANEKTQTFFSTPSSLVNALEVVLREIDRVGFERVQTRIETLAEATRLAGTALGLEVFSKAPAPAVTALVVPSIIPGEKLRDWLEEERNVIVMGGQDRLKGRVLRIGHMGDISDDDMIAFFEALAAGLDHFEPSLGAHKKLPTALSTLKTCLKNHPAIFS